MDSERLRRRIRARLRQLGRSPIDAASKGGLERSYLLDFVKEQPRKDSIKVDKYPQVAAGLDWSVEELLHTTAVNGGEREGSPTHDSQVAIPEYDLRAGAGGGGFAASEELTIDESGNTQLSESVRASWGFPAPFLRDELRIRPGRVHILPIRGDSMVDTLYDGDRAVIDLDDTDIAQGGIFALRDDNGSVIIKQVEYVRSEGQTRIRCTSRNKDYAPFELHLVEPVAVLGRVACRITRL